MTAPFDSFVVFAEMRTGSNLLEDYLNQVDGLTCYGEAFNPNFIGYPDTSDILGITQARREKDPMGLVSAIRHGTPGLGGFRFFHDHDPRILSDILTDPRCAKIILTRNPLDSYVSLKIARATDQWKLTNVKNRKSAKARFEAAEFRDMLATLQTFQETLQKALQVTGQTAFYIQYDDLHDAEVLTGLTNWLGMQAPEDGFSSALKPQNPAPISEKVENLAAMETALAQIDPFALSQIPNFEPKRGPVVPAYSAHPELPLLYMPIRSGPEASVTQWMRDLGTSKEDLIQQMTQKDLRNWMEAQSGFRSFCVLRHPLLRAHSAFCDLILSTGPGSFAKIRNRLVKHHGMDLPEGDADMSVAEHKAAFKVFLKFLKLNLAGQTGIRVDAHWASQTSTLQGMSEFRPPDHLFREDEISEALPKLARSVGAGDAPFSSKADNGALLTQIYTPDIESMCRSAYARDYQMLGFGDYKT